MQSLFDSNKDLGTLEVFICSDHITKENQAKLKNIAKKYSRKITFLDYQILDDVGKRLHWKSQGGSFNTYSKLLMQKFLPSYVDRIVYIDSSDTLVVGSLKPLETFDMKGAAFAARVAMSFHATGNHIPSYDFIVAQHKTYYNGGVFLVDMKRWKELKCFEIIEKKSLEEPHFDIYDQTVINSYLPEEMGTILPLKYNFNGYTYAKYLEKKKLSIGGFYSEQEIEDASKHPVIIHWPGGIHHPYVKGGLCRHKDLYMKYLSKSLWRKEIQIQSIGQMLPKDKGFAYRYFPLVEFYMPRTSVAMYKIVSSLRKNKGAKGK